MLEEVFLFVINIYLCRLFKPECVAWHLSKVMGCSERVDRHLIITHVWLQNKQTPQSSAVTDRQPLFVGTMKPLSWAAESHSVTRRGHLESWNAQQQRAGNNPPAASFLLLHNSFLLGVSVSGSDPQRTAPLPSTPRDIQLVGSCFLLSDVSTWSVFSVLSLNLDWTTRCFKMYFTASQKRALRASSVCELAAIGVLYRADVVP